MKKLLLISVIVVWLFLWFLITPIPISATNVLTDPFDAAVDDIGSITGGFDSTSLFLRADFRPGSFNSSNLGFIWGLDTDLNPSTPVYPPSTIFPLGADYAVWFNTLGNTTQATVTNQFSGTKGYVPVSFGANSLNLTIPLSLLGGSNGTANFGLGVGVPTSSNSFTATDFTPNIGNPLGGPTTPVPGYIPKPNFSNYYALLTGWDIARQSIENFSSWLVNLGWKAENIINMVSDSWSKNAILTMVNNISNKMKPNDKFLFYYAGHADAERDDPVNMDESRAGSFTVFDVSKLKLIDYFYKSDEYLALPNGERIYDDDLTGWFNTDQWKNVKKTFILDSCLSGGFWGGNDTNSFGDLERLSNVRLLAGSAEDQLDFVIRDPITGQWYSQFYGQLKLALDFKQADLNNDGFITFEELESYLSVLPLRQFVASNIMGLDYNDLYAGDQGPQVFSNISFDDEPFGVYNPVPEPSTMLLLGSGLIALVGYGRKKFFKK
jgi:hypothetical protein